MTKLNLSVCLVALLLMASFSSNIHAQTFFTTHSTTTSTLNVSYNGIECKAGVSKVLDRMDYETLTNKQHILKEAIIKSYAHASLQTREYIFNIESQKEIADEIYYIECYYADVTNKGVKYFVVEIKSIIDSLSIFYTLSYYDRDLQKLIILLNQEHTILDPSLMDIINYDEIFKKNTTDFTEEERKYMKGMVMYAFSVVDFNLKISDNLDTRKMAFIDTHPGVQFLIPVRAKLSDFEE